MQITFDPLNPLEVADTINLLRVLGAIDAGVRISIDGEPTLSEAEARKAQAEVQRRFHAWRAPPPPAPASDLSSLNLDLDL